MYYTRLPKKGKLTSNSKNASLDSVRHTRRRLMKGIFDLDGCILGGGNSKEERRARFEIGELIEAQDLDEGLFCSGRGSEYCLAVAKMHGFRRGIAEHGAFFILDADHDVVIENPMLQNADRALPVEQFEAFLRRFGGRLYRGKSICLAGYPPPGMTPRELYERARVEFQNGPGNFTYSDIAVDWTLPDLTKKGSLISFISAFARDIHLPDCFGIEDSVVDDSWLGLLANRISCPANSSEECKEFVAKNGGYITKKGFAQGTLEGIKHFIGNWPKYSMTSK